MTSRQDGQPAKRIVNEAWVQLARARLQEWGAVMRSVQLPDLGQPHQAGFMQVIAGAEIESETAQRIEDYLLRIKAASPSVYQAMFYSYYLQLADMDAADRMRMADRSYRQMRLVGEAMVHAYWETEDDAGKAAQKKKFDKRTVESAGFVAR